MPPGATTFRGASETERSQRSPSQNDTDVAGWDYAGLMKDWTNDEGRGLGLHAKSAGELTAALTRATTHDGPCLIEVAIDPQDCSVDMREWGTRVAAANGRPRRS